MSDTPISPENDHNSHTDHGFVTGDVETGDVVTGNPGTSVEAESSALDLAAIERDLDGVELALKRLDAGTYWTDEVTGETLADEFLAANPVARRA